MADNGLEAGIEPASLDATDHAIRANGYDASFLIDLCKAILAAKADGKLSGSLYDKMAAQAPIVMNASAKNGIRQLLYALAGYNPTAEEVIGQQEFLFGQRRLAPQ